MAQLTYNPGIFDVADEAAARSIILQTTGALDTDQRWRTETPYLAELIGDRIEARPGALIVDYGCGIGRMAKALIERHGCHVLGVDISQDMRALAPTYVASPNFSVVSREVFLAMMKAGLRADGTFSVWVIQHCLAPNEDLDLIRAGLRIGGRLAMVNMKGRAVPTVEKPWARDGIDVRQLLAERFAMREEGVLDAAVVGQLISDVAFWGVYDRV